MGRMYSVIMDNVAVTAAQDLVRISAPSTAVVKIHEVKVTNEDVETSNQVAYQLQRSSTDGTGTAATPEAFDTGSTVFGGTVVVDLSADTTISGAPLWKEGQNILNGFHWLPTPETQITVPPSGRFVVRLDSAPAGSTQMSATVVFEEIGT